MLDRTIAPPFNRIDAVDVVEAKHLQLSSGLPLYYIDAGSQEVIKLDFLTKAGSSFEDVSGVSFFTNKMLTEGTKNHTYSEIAEFFEFYGAQIEASPGLDFLGLTVYVLRKHLKDILPLFRELLSEPNFGEKELETQKSLKTDSLKVNLEKNQFLSSRKIREYIFGVEHPYGRSLEIENISSVQASDLVKYFESAFFNNPTLIVSGKVKEEDLTMISQSFSGLVFEDKKRPDFPSQVQQPVNNVIERPRSMQSSIKLGKKSLHKNHPDYINLLIANEILGGYFGSRLMKNIREDKGYTYGIYSNIMNLTGASIQVIGTDVKKEFTQQTLDEIFKEIKTLQTELVSENELETVKNYMQGSFLSSITTPFSLADKFKGVHFYDLDYSFYNQYLQTIKEITPETILKTANEQFEIDSFSSVVVGGME